jgi:carbon-monoxide dehydrogenase medium subunit
MRYECPTTTKDAVQLLSKSAGRAYVLAGGTDLLVRLRTGFIEPSLIVDIKRIAGMRSIRKVASGFEIGAAVCGAELGANEAVRKAWPGVVEAVNLIGSKQIQGRATMVGNLCNASPAADSVPAMVAAAATAVISGPRRRRTVPVEQLLKGPGQIALAKGEIIESILLPRRPPRSGDAYLRFIPRSEMDIAVVGAAVSLTLDGKGICTEARVALGAVAPTVILVKEAGKALIGTPVDDPALARMAQACSAACRPIDDKRGTKDFRIKVAGVLARRAARIALKRAGGRP